jgi:transglutaminase-like putative cysteine protease
MRRRPYYRRAGQAATRSLSDRVAGAAGASLVRQAPGPSRRAFFGTLLTLASSPWALASVSLPPWMQSQVATSLPQHDSDADAVTLYSDVNVTVTPDGKIRRLQRIVYRILRNQGARRAVVRVDFDAQSRITRMHGWSVPAEGKPYEVSEKDSVESALIGVLYGELMGDLRSKVLRIPAAVPGSTIGYEVEEELQPYTLEDDWAFQDTIPVREAHYSLELPPGWSYKATWINHPEEPSVQSTATHWQWQVQDVKAIKPEVRMPPMAAIEGRLAVSLVPPAGVGASLQSWRDLGAWYRGLTLDRRVASADIKSKAAELTASQVTSLGKIQALGTFVQSDIRYVAIELGIGGLQPHSAQSVFAHRYGDCKDKVTLLSTMLKEIGVDSHYLIVNTTRGAVTDSTPVGFRFNHVILAIQLPQDTQGASLPATLTHGKLGRLLLFDPTDTYTPLGQLAGPLQGGYGLLITPVGGELIEIPVLPADTSSIQRTAHLQLDESGRLSGEVHEIWAGDPASQERGTLDLMTQETDRVKSIESVLASSFPTFQLTKAAITNRQIASKPLEWTYSLEVDQYARPTGNLLTVRPRVLGSMSTGLLETREPRRYDIELEGPRRDTDSFEITMPEGYGVDDLPPPVDEDYPFAAYHSKTEAVGRTLKYTRVFEMKSVSVPVAQADQLKELYRIINNDERMPAVLKKTSP